MSPGAPYITEPRITCLPIPLLLGYFELALLRGDVGREAKRKGTTMPERMNVEIAHKLAESESESEPDPEKRFRRWLIEIAEAVALSVIAVATASAISINHLRNRFSGSGSDSDSASL